MKRTRCNVVTGTITLTADDDEYDLNAVLNDPPLAILNIINSDNAPLQRESVEMIHQLRRGTNPVGTNVYRYAVEGSNLLMLYPTPDAAGSLTAYYVPTPNEMDSGDDDPSAETFGGIPVEYHDLLEFWACFRMAMYDDHVSSGRGQQYKQLFEEGVIRARADIRRRGGRTLGPARPGRRQRIPWNPGQDIWRG